MAMLNNQMVIYIMMGYSGIGYLGSAKHGGWPSTNDVDLI